jgi:hypothetical protein
MAVKGLAVRSRLRYLPAVPMLRQISKHPQRIPPLCRYFHVLYDSTVSEEILPRSEPVPSVLSRTEEKRGGIDRRFYSTIILI